MCLAEEMGREIHTELTKWGFTVPLEACIQAAEVHVTQGKEEAANVLRAVGVPIKTAPETWNGCKFTRWTVGKHVLFCG